MTCTFLKYTHTHTQMHAYQRGWVNRVQFLLLPWSNNGSSITGLTTQTVPREREMQKEKERKGADSNRRGSRLKKSSQQNRLARKRDSDGEKEKREILLHTGYTVVLQGFVSSEVARQKLYFITWIKIARLWEWLLLHVDLRWPAYLNWSHASVRVMVYIRKWPGTVLSLLFDTSVYGAPVRTQPLLGTSHPCVSLLLLLLLLLLLHILPAPSLQETLLLLPSFLPPSLPPSLTPTSLLSGPLSLLCLLPLSIYLLGWKSQWGSTFEGAFPVCIIVCVCVCGWALMCLCVYMRLCLCKCVFVYVIKILLTLAS